MRTTRPCWKRVRAVAMTATAGMLIASASAQDDPTRTFERPDSPVSSAPRETREPDRSARRLAELHATLDRIERNRLAMRADLDSISRRSSSPRDARPANSTSGDERLRVTVTNVAVTNGAASGLSTSRVAAPRDAMTYQHDATESDASIASAAPTAASLLPTIEATLERLRSDWLDESASRPRVALHIDWNARSSGGSTLPPLRADGPYRVRIAASDERTFEHTLAHELTHVVLLARCGDSLPAWVQEGIASQEDDPVRQRIRRQIVERWATTGRYPDLSIVVQRADIAADDVQSYAAAATLVEFLALHLSRREFIAFIDRIGREGWSGATTSIGFRDMPRLESAWRRWLMMRSERLARPER